LTADFGLIIFLETAEDALAFLSWEGFLKRLGVDVGI